jgi:hypothetical protein
MGYGWRTLFLPNPGESRACPPIEVEKTRKTKAVERLAAALIEFMEASEAEYKARSKRAVGVRFDQMDTQLDHQDESLRLM